MIHIIKRYKWVIATSLICILFGILTFFTFINQSSILLKDLDLQILLTADLFLLLIFFTLIIRETYKILKERKSKKLGSETSSRYFIFFTTTTLLPSILIAILSLVLFNVGLQKYFDDKIKSVVNNSAEVAKNYVDQARNSVETDISLVVLDINRNTELYYTNPNQFLKVLITQRFLRKLDEVHLLDSSGNIIMSNVIDPSINFVPPPEEAFNMVLNGRPVRITDPNTNRTSALIKLENFIDTYLYIVKFLDPQVIQYLQQTNEAVSFYFTVQDSKTGIKITFAFIYLLIVSLLLFLSIIISINFSTRLTGPIINLIRASEKISLGDLTAKVPKIEADREFEKLNENFNLMIDRLKKQQDKLLLTERHLAWENVARKLAHEIKNPLTPIQLSIDRIRDKYLKNSQNDKDFSKYLDTITKQIHDIEHLVTEFSDFARMPKPTFKKTNLNSIISRAINLHELSETHIKFIYPKKRKEIYIDCDQEQINRVLINLLKNSIESINERKQKNPDFRGKINVDIDEDRDYIYLTVEDNGLGFDKIDKIKMVNPYFTTKKKGTGLGLAIVTKIINDHNSLITFKSIEDGAKVEITLPKKL